MARGKKTEKILAQEEKLQQALVPESEWPFKVPENWRYYRINGLVTHLKRGKAPKYVQQSNILVFAQKCNQKDGTIAMEKAQFLNPEIAVRIKEDEFLKDEDVLINSTGTGTLGRVGYYRSHYALPYLRVLPDSHMTVIRSLSIVSPKYLYYYLKSKQEYLELQGVGTTNQKELRPEAIGNSIMPLPPLPEQQRIVDCIESLFAKLDEAKEKAQAVVDGFENRKAAILHRAFTGGYSRINNGHSVDDILQEVYQIRESLVASKMIQRPKTKELSSNEYYKSFPSHWKQVRLGAIAFVTKLAGFEYTKYIHLETTGDVPVIRAQNVRSGYLDTTNLLYIDKDTSDLLQRSALDKPSILITFIGAGIGDVCVFDEKRRFHLAPNVAKVEPFCDKNDNLINIRYILHYLMSSYGQHEIFKHMKATAQPSLSMETIRNIIIPIPDIEEQNRIVILLDYILEKELQVKESAEQVIDQIDTMKKSILARAFRGELGTNDPSDESAEELLKRIL